MEARLQKYTQWIDDLTYEASKPGKILGHECLLISFIKISTEHKYGVSLGFLPGVSSCFLTHRCRNSHNTIAVIDHYASVLLCIVVFMFNLLT